MEVFIRAACALDAQAVNETYDYYIDHTVATFNEVHKSIADREQEIVQLMQTYPFLIAEDSDGTFLGFACAEPFRTQSGYRFTPELTIYLHPAAPKGCGIGSRLYEKLLDLLTRQGFANAVAVLSGSNEESLALHRHFGFEQAAFLPQVGYKHGRWLDARIMRKQLCGFADSPAEPIPFPHFQKDL